MAHRKTILNSARDLIASAERIDIEYTGGVILQEVDVAYFTDELFNRLRDRYGTSIEIHHFEPLINGVKVQVLPIEQANLFYVFCQSCRGLVDSITPAEFSVNEFSIIFKLRPPVRLLPTICSIFMLLTLAACCHYIIIQIDPNFNALSELRTTLFPKVYHWWFGEYGGRF